MANDIEVRLVGSGESKAPAAEAFRPSTAAYVVAVDKFANRGGLPAAVAIMATGRRRDHDRIAVSARNSSFLNPYRASVCSELVEHGASGDEQGTERQQIKVRNDNRSRDGNCELLWERVVCATHPVQVSPPRSCISFLCALEERCGE